MTYIIPCAIITKNIKIITNPNSLQLESRKLFWRIIFRK
jgi:hypothetical protein